MWPVIWVDADRTDLLHQRYIKNGLIDRNSYVIIYASERTKWTPINELLMTIPM